MPVLNRAPLRRLCLAAALLMCTPAMAQTPDLAAAVAEAEAGAKKGDAQAQYLLGAMYLSGIGVTQDDAQAVAWLTRAAGQKHADAEATLGVMYRDGRGVAADPAAAVTWFRRAAEQNSFTGQFNMAIAYYSGVGVPKDRVLAYMWLVVAEQSARAPQEIEALGEAQGIEREDLSTEDMIKAQTLAEKCLTNGLKNCGV